MATIELNEKNFEETVTAEGKITFVDFWAPWCAPCVRFAPVFEAASDRHEDIVFAKVNTQDEQGIAQAVGIQSIPTLMVFRDGVLLVAQSGALPAAALDAIAAKVRELDMDEVKKTIADEEAKAAAAKDGASKEEAPKEDAPKDAALDQSDPKA
ncbi:MAG: thioredoxin fold domain-containing protein [Polyangiaceae bacterium]|nr:thioredoxin fold domain-containing protein [Polyangiaceae bacterium]